MEGSNSSLFNKKYFYQILKEHHKSFDSIKIISIIVLPCNGTSEGFHSSLNRVFIEYEDLNTNLIHKTSLITKSECTNKFSIDKVGKNGFDVQNKEMNFFLQIASKMLKIFGPDMPKIFPNVLKIDKEHNVLVFEDLTELNYKTADRFLGLDEQHVKLCLHKFAKFHAASLKIYKNDLNAFKDFQKGMFGSQVDQFDFPIVTLYHAAVEEISTWHGYEEYGRNLGRIKDMCLKKLKMCFDVNDDELNVLNQGDLWTNNLMFQYEKKHNVLKNLVLIDFQFCHYGSFALDLIRFIFTSINDELYNPDGIKLLLKTYHSELSNNLQLLGINEPKARNFENLLKEFYSKLHFGMIYNLCVLPVMICDDLDNDFIAHHTDDERSRAFKRRIMKSDRYQRIVKRMLPFYESMGLMNQ